MKTKKENKKNVLAYFLNKNRRKETKIRQTPLKPNSILSEEEKKKAFSEKSKKDEKQEKIGIKEMLVKSFNRIFKKLTS